MAEKAHFCKNLLAVGLAELLVSHTRILHLAKGLCHSLRELSAEVVMALSHILQARVLCGLLVPMEAREIVFYTLQVQMEAQEIVFHILQVQMAVLVKVVFHSLERKDFFHIQQAHLGRRIAQDDLLEDSH